MFRSVGASVSDSPWLYFVNKRNDDSLAAGSGLSLFLMLNCLARPKDMTRNSTDLCILLKICVSMLCF